MNVNKLEHSMDRGFIETSFGGPVAIEYSLSPVQFRPKIVTEVPVVEKVTLRKFRTRRTERQTQETAVVSSYNPSN
jgi:hypothetical protein